MNRRTAMFFSLLAGAFAPRALFGQDSPRRTASRSRGQTLEPKSRRPAADEEPDSESSPLDDSTIPGLAEKGGQKWRTWNIKPYTSLGLPHAATSPQSAILDWIFRRTTDAVWHGEKPAALNATRNEIRAYHDAETLAMVAEVIERFVQAKEDILTVHIQLLRADNVKWRYPIFNQLDYKQSGAQGQQVWELDQNQAALVMAQLQMQGHKLLTNRQVEMINGQTLKVNTTVNRGFVGGTQRSSNAALGPQGRTDKLMEGVWLSMSPLLTFDADALDIGIELTSNTVRTYHRTRVIAPRDAGAGEINIDVPEVSQTYLRQTIKDVKLGKTLLISAGIQPGILDENKNGFMNLRIPGTVPTSSELLLFLDIKVSKKSKKVEE
jgi:hypothetical protein